MEIPTVVRKLTPVEYSQLKRQLPPSIRQRVLGFFASCPTRHAYGVRERANHFVESITMSHAAQLVFWQYVGKMLNLPDAPPVRGTQMIPLELF